MGDVVQAERQFRLWQWRLWWEQALAGDMPAFVLIEHMRREPEFGVWAREQYEALQARREERNS